MSWHLIIERRAAPELPYYSRMIFCRELWALLFYVELYEAKEWKLHIRIVVDEGSSYDRNI